jgi:copper transport protein
MKHKIASGFKPTLFLLSLFLGLFAFGGSPALAHNAFDSSSPFDGETVESPPGQWSITFTKSVPLETFSGEIINGDGVRTQLTNAVHGASDNIVVATLPTALSGAITARWKLVSSDGHVVSGRVAFSVGAATSSSSAPETTVDAVTEFNNATSVPETVRWSLRMLGYLAIIFLGGLIFAELFLAEGAMAAATGRRLLLMSSAAITVVPILQGWIFLADVNGYSFFKAPLDTFDLFSSTPGSMILTRALTGAAISYAAVVAWPQITNTIKERQAIGLIGVYLVTLAYTSHSRSQALPLLGIPVDVLHVAASAVWLGGLAVIALTMIPLVDPKNALLTYTRYGRYAQYAVITIVVTGVIQTLRLHGVSLSSLFGERHGQILLLKIVAVGLMLKVGDINRRRLLKNLPTEESSMTKRSTLLLRASYTELVCGLLVLVLTSALVTSSFN